MAAVKGSAADGDTLRIVGGTVFVQPAWQLTMNSIEGTLDTIRGAFEKQLDSLFEDTAVDITADISVLKNQLAQNGLAEYQMTGNNLSEVPATAQAIDEIQQVLSQGK